MIVEPSTLPWKDAYKLLIGSVLPRPIAFVSTVDLKGRANLAPFSFFTCISAEPMLICFSPMVRGSDGAKKDTLVNIEATKEFIINIVSEDIINQVNECATEFPFDTDEFIISGLNKEAGSKVNVPRVKECLIHLECSLYELHHYGSEPGSGSLVIGKVELISIADHLYENGKINTQQLNPIGRMAGQSYLRAASDTFILNRIKKGDSK
ncbi:flavin reductase family protein [Chengkuizengella axinellae]|uniref:Flavin reductase family protein n=1 Tax=Chengkuizengella axinellae TaxID=3064388 RepID=A0ABT9J5M3_9BACL|nr:flavin reductase family protein [Chengkuizengella sp. 2205SS18-9]MDP5276752.1 flavin reductase family protein [Chengkuizengella sp. 2205SS18-9]